LRSDDAAVARQIIELSLKATKSATIANIYGRIKPGEDGRIRTVLSPVGTETGRMSSADTFLEESTNLQNIPKKTAMLDPLYDVRRCMVPQHGHAIVEVDLSQAEARATSAYAKDYTTLDLFTSGQDIHKITASRIFGVPVSEITKEQRHLGKMARHALNYGMGWSLFVDEINKDADLTGVAISAAFGKSIVEGYHAQNPLLTLWWDKVWQDVQTNGYLVNAFGRRRDFLSPYVRKTDVIAYLPQSTIADLLNWRLTVLYREAPWIKLLLQVHDAIVAEVPLHRVDEACAVMKECVEREHIECDGVNVHIPADVSYSHTSWGEMHKWKEA
jgi:DNA polymerase-1